ncbi:MAG: IS21 family transposase, partial [Mesorhizobium sp.]
AEDRAALRPLPLAPFRSVLKLERRISREGMVSVGGNFYSVPDATRRRVVEVHTLADEIRILENGVLIATHPVLDGRHQRHVLAGHRVAQARPRRQRSESGEIILHGSGDRVVQRPLAFYDAVARAMAREQRP